MLSGSSHGPPAGTEVVTRREQLGWGGLTVKSWRASVLAGARSGHLHSRTDVPEISEGCTGKGRVSLSVNYTKLNDEKAPFPVPD